MPLRLIDPPVGEPVTIPEAKLHLREDGTDQDLRIEDLIAAAREATEEATLRALITQTWELTLPCFPRGREPIRLERPPVTEVSEVAYVDSDGVNQTVADFRLVADAPALLFPEPGETWPSVQRHNPEAVTVTFTAGYGDSGEDVPHSLREAILLGVATRYEHREDTIVGTIVGSLRAIDALHDQYRWQGGVR